MNPRDSECPLSKGRHLVAEIHNVEEADCTKSLTLPTKSPSGLNQVTAETLSYFVHLFAKDSTFKRIHSFIHLFPQQTFILIKCLLGTRHY